VLEAREIETDLYEVIIPESINTKNVGQVLKVTLDDFDEVTDDCL